MAGIVQQKKYQSWNGAMTAASCDGAASAPSSAPGWRFRFVGRTRTWP